MERMWLLRAACEWLIASCSTPFFRSLKLLCFSPLFPYNTTQSDLTCPPAFEPDPDPSQEPSASEPQPSVRNDKLPSAQQPDMADFSTSRHVAGKSLNAHDHGDRRLLIFVHTCIKQTPITAACHSALCKVLTDEAKMNMNINEVRDNIAMAIVFAVAIPVIDLVYGALFGNDRAMPNGTRMLDFIRQIVRELLLVAVPWMLALLYLTVGDGAVRISLYACPSDFSHALDIAFNVVQAVQIMRYFTGLFGWL